MIKKSLILLVMLGIVYGQVPLSGLAAYYGAPSVSSAGVSGVFENVDGEQINPANIMPLEPQARVSIIKYPANIYAQSANYVTELKRSMLSVSLRRINYGTFYAADESGMADGTYSAGDTWINAAYAKNSKNLSYGVGGGMFLSNLESYTAAALVFSTGTVYDLSKADICIGFSLSNIGLYLKQYTNYKEKLPLRMTFSMSKVLKYLPLELNGDISFESANSKIFGRFGGIFQLPYNFDIVFGINSDNLDQASEYKSIKSLLGGTGIGLSFKNSQYNIMIGGYSFGSGGWIYGTTFGYLFNSSIN